jgi:cytochrome c oxidase cbb3-type subunit 3
MKLIKLLLLSLMIFSVHAYAEKPSGKILYQAYCSQCHGMEGDGFGINAAEMNVLPKDHSDKEGMLNRTDNDLFKAIKEGGKAVNKSVLMPNWDSNLTDDEIHSLVTHLRVLCCE